MNDTKVTLIWHRKCIFESTKMEEQVNQLLLLQAAYMYLEYIITVTNSVVAQVVQDKRNEVEVWVPVKCETKHKRNQSK